MATGRSIRINTQAIRSSLSVGSTKIALETAGRLAVGFAETLADQLLEEKTGAYHHGFSFEIVGDRIRLTNSADHDVMVEDGTRPHIIRGNPRLRFYWAKVGEYVVFRRVNHPGAKRYRIKELALRRALRAVGGGR